MDEMKTLQAHVLAISNTLTLMLSKNPALRAEVVRLADQTAAFALSQPVPDEQIDLMRKFMRGMAGQLD